jgi:subtilase family serine protease
MLLWRYQFTRVEARSTPKLARGSAAPIDRVGFRLDGIAFTVLLMLIFAYTELLITLSRNRLVEVETFLPVAHANAPAQLNIEVTLGLRNRAALNELLQDQQDPGSPLYHKWLSRQEFNARYRPSQQDADTVAQWLNTQGFQVTETSLSGCYVGFTGRVGDAERAFANDIIAFGDGSSFSNTTHPIIPARFADVIAEIGGLENVLHYLRPFSEEWPQVADENGEKVPRLTEDRRLYSSSVVFRG